MNRTREFLLTNNVLLIAIILAALALRVWGVTFDLPYISHPDESHEVHRALRLGAGDFEFERIGKGGYFYLLFLEYGIFFLLLKLFGTISSVNDFMLYFFRDPTYFWLIGRVTTALIGTLNVWLVYLLGKRAYDSRVGIMSAGFLAFCTLNALHAHYITVDVPMTFGVIITVYFALRVYETGHLKFYLLAGFFSALATMTKLTAAPVILTVCLAHIFNYWEQHKKINVGILDKRIILCGVVASSFYVLGNPGIVILAVKFVKSITMPLNTQAVKETGFSLSRSNLWMYYGYAIWNNLGFSAFILIASGVVYAIIRRSKYDFLLLIFPVLLYIVISSTSMSFMRNPRYLLPALPFVFILGARFLFEIFDYIKLSSKWAAILSTILIVAICAPQIHLIVNQNIAFCRPGTPILAKNWIEENISAQSKILVEGYQGAPSERRLCPLQDKVENMEMLADQLEKESPLGAVYVKNKASMQEGKAYDLVVIKPRSPWMKLDEVKRKNIQYVVIPLERFQDSPRRHSAQVRESRLAFYRAILTDANVKLLQRFYPQRTYDDHATPRGFHIEIYKIGAGEFPQTL